MPAMATGGKPGKGRTCLAQTHSTHSEVQTAPVGLVPRRPRPPGRNVLTHAPVMREVARASPAGPCGSREAQREGSGEPAGRSSPTSWLQLRDRRGVLARRLGELPGFEQLVALTLQAGRADRGGGGGR